MRNRLLVALAGLLLVAGVTFATTTLTATAIFGVSGTHVNDLDLGNDPSYSFKGGKTISFANGTGASQADMVFADQRTIAASTTEDLDVAGGALVDAFGNTFTIAELKVLMVCAAAANTNNVVLGGDANSVPFFGDATDIVSIKPGGCFQLADPSAGGYAVTAATGDIIQVANSGAGTTVTYDIIIAGSSS